MYMAKRLGLSHIHRHCIGIYYLDKQTTCPFANNTESLVWQMRSYARWLSLYICKSTIYGNKKFHIIWKIMRHERRIKTKPNRQRKQEHLRSAFMYQQYKINTEQNILKLFSIASTWEYFNLNRLLLHHIFMGASLEVHITEKTQVSGKQLLWRATSWVIKFV